MCAGVANYPFTFMTNKRFITGCPSDKDGEKSDSLSDGTRNNVRPFDVFAADVETSIGPHIDSLGGATDTNLKPITGHQLLLNQILATWMKLFLIWTRSWTMTILQILAPVLIINTTLALIFYATRTSVTIEKRALTLTEGLDFQKSCLCHIVE